MLYETVTKVEAGRNGSAPRVLTAQNTSDVGYLSNLRWIKLRERCRDGTGIIQVELISSNVSGSLKGLMSSIITLQPLLFSLCPCQHPFFNPQCTLLPILGTEPRFPWKQTQYSGGPRFNYSVWQWSGGGFTPLIFCSQLKSVLKFGPNKVEDLQVTSPTKTWVGSRVIHLLAAATAINTTQDGVKAHWSNDKREN